MCDESEKVVLSKPLRSTFQDFIIMTPYLPAPCVPHPTAVTDFE